MSVTIYHNPACGTSRNTLAMIRQSGEEPEVIEYLKTPPSRARLVGLIAAMGITARELLREKGTPYAELVLSDPKWTDDELIDFMLAHPILINRPVVVTPKEACWLCRPSERVLDLLDRPVRAVKEGRRRRSSRNANSPAPAACTALPHQQRACRQHGAEREYRLLRNRCCEPDADCGRHHLEETDQRRRRARAVAER